MTTTILAALFVFGLGLWLSAFFSGSETGFYRVSFVRLSIEAHAGDTAAKRVLWFALRPAAFVGTTLVGNNVANYLTTIGIALGLAAVLGVGNDRPVAWDMAATLAFSPLVFVFGELMPKHLYFHAPLQRLRRNAILFDSFYWLFCLISWPLIQLTRWLERFGPGEERPTTLVLGRKRLVQVLEEGHEQGLLSDIQDRLVNGLLNTAQAPVDDFLMPAGQVLGLPETAGRDEVLAFAGRYGLAEVPLHRAGQPGEWYGCLGVVSLALCEKPLNELVMRLPEMPSGTSRLEALLALNEAGAPLGVVRGESAVVGLVTRRELTEQLVQRQVNP